MTELQERIANAIRKYPGKDNNGVTRSFKGVRAAQIQEVRDMLNSSGESPSSYQLRGMKVMSRRPPESAAKFIKRLPNGQGFDPKKLSEQWGMSEETIRKHAREMGCLKYVEITEDEWVPLVLNPETAKNYA